MADTTRVADDIAMPEEVARALDTSLAGLAQLRYRGTGPRFVKRGSRVLYRWSDVSEYLDSNTIGRTGDPLGINPSGGGGSSPPSTRHQPRSGLSTSPKRSGQELGACGGDAARSGAPPGNPTLAASGGTMSAERGGGS